MSQTKLFVLVGPSGSGKSMLMDKIMARRTDFAYIKSVTTRKPRSQNESNYVFVTETEFNFAIERRELLEWSRYAGELYGTTFTAVDDVLHAGKNAIKAMEYQGAICMKERYGERCVTIFLHRPKDAVIQAIQERTCSDAEKARRIASLDEEYERKNLFDHILFNNLDPENLYQQFIALVD